MTTNPEPDRPASNAQQFLSRQLVAARHKARLSQEDLAQSLGVSRQAVAAWEASDGGITLSTAAGWAAALGMSLSLTPVGGDRPVLLDPDGRLVSWRTLSMHAVVTGPARALVLEALANSAGNLPVTSLVLGSPPARAEATRLLESLRRRELEPTVLVIEAGEQVDGDLELVLDVLSRARSSGAIVLVGVDESPAGALWQNVALRLHAALGGVVRSDDGSVWSISR